MADKHKVLTPKAFRIRNFKCIQDSGVCPFSSDGITVLAGQNESGKSAVLSALRDFDLAAGDDPDTADYLPDDDKEADSSVAILFAINEAELDAQLTDDDPLVPPQVVAQLKYDKEVWVTRHLTSGRFELEKKVADLFSADENLQSLSEVKNSLTELAKKLAKPKTISDFCEWLRKRWPLFIYFDSFEGILPRTVDVDTLVTEELAKKAPQAVQDFITLSGISIAKVKELEKKDKDLGNYLRSCTAQITGDFLSFWKQRFKEQETVTLQVEHQRDSTGKLQLHFYVHDRYDQYPEQRSKGFLWFLSFYLHLAATNLRDIEEERINRALLIDEPGTFLHARAQKDVLDLFERRLTNRDLIVYSTHSPFLIPADRLHRLRVVVKTRKDGTLVIDRLTHPALRGKEFADTLSPILMAIGIDLTQSLVIAKKKNLIVEGISDHFYLHALGAQSALEDIHVFPAFGAMSTTTLASLFIGWGLEFAVLLDRDDAGTAARDKLVKELSVPESRIILPDQAAGIEDLLSPDDFKAGLKAYDPNLKQNDGESNSKTIRRLGVDKVLLARLYSELVSAEKVKPTHKTQENFKRLFNSVKESLSIAAKKAQA